MIETQTVSYKSFWINMIQFYIISFLAPDNPVLFFFVKPKKDESFRLLRKRD